MKSLIKKLLRESLLKEDVLTKDEFFIKYGIDEDDLSYLGSGDFGKAYSVGDGKVLKITNSKSEFGFAKEIAGKNIPALDGFADIYVAEKVDNQYYIIMEELDEDSDIEDLYYQVEELLSNEGLPIQYLHMLDTDELELDDDLLKFISDIEDINRSYRYLGIEASDIKPDNLGVDKNGKVKAFDIDDRSINEQYKHVVNEEITTNNILYHGSGDDVPFKKFYDNQFFTVNDYIANNYAYNNGGLVYKVKANISNSLELKGNYHGMDKREPNRYEFEYNLIKKLYGDDALDYWDKRGFNPSPANTFNGDWRPIIEWAKSNGYDSIKFIDESFDKAVRDMSYIIFDSNRIEILNVSEPEI